MLKSAAHILRRWRRLSWKNRAALGRAVVLVGLVRAALAVLPFRRVMRGLRRLARPRARLTRRLAEPLAFRRIVWSAETAGRWLLPSRPCLTQALVGHLLLRRRGYAAELRIGVAKEDGGLAAHAWVEQDGRIILGGASSRERYRPLPAFYEDA